MSLIKKTPRVIKPPFGQARLKQGHPLNQGLVGWWLMNEGGGLKAYDLSGKGNHGTLTNGPTWVNGERGKALSFDGVDDSVYISRPVVNELPISFSMWARQTSAGVTNCIISMSDEATTDSFYLVGINSSGKFEVRNGDGLGSDSATSTTTVTLNRWYHVVGVWTTNTDRKVYFNGVLETTNTNSRPTNNSLLDNTAFGMMKRSSELYSLGQIDDVRIYNRALSAGEIQSLYSNPLAALEPLPSIIWAPSAGAPATATNRQYSFVTG